MLKEFNYGPRLRFYARAYLLHFVAAFYTGTSIYGHACSNYAKQPLKVTSPEFAQSCAQSGLTAKEASTASVEAMSLCSHSVCTFYQYVVFYYRPKGALQLFCGNCTILVVLFITGDTCRKMLYKNQKPASVLAHTSKSQTSFQQFKSIIGTLFFPPLFRHPLSKNKMRSEAKKRYCMLDTKFKASSFCMVGRFTTDKRNPKNDYFPKKQSDYPFIEGNHYEKKTGTLTELSESIFRGRSLAAKIKKIGHGRVEVKNLSELLVEGNKLAAYDAEQIDDIFGSAKGLPGAEKWIGERLMGGKRIYFITSIITVSMAKVEKRNGSTSVANVGGNASLPGNGPSVSFSGGVENGEMSMQKIEWDDEELAVAVSYHRIGYDYSIRDFKCVKTVAVKKYAAGEILPFKGGAGDSYTDNGKPKDVVGEMDIGFITDSDASESTESEPDGNDYENKG